MQPSLTQSLYMCSTLTVLLFGLLIFSRVLILSSLLQESLFNSNVFNIQPKNWFSYVEKIIIAKWQGSAPFFSHTKMDLIVFLHQSASELLQQRCPGIDDNHSTSLTGGFPVTLVTSPMGIITKREQGEDREIYSTR